MMAALEPELWPYWDAGGNCLPSTPDSELQESQWDTALSPPQNQVHADGLTCLPHWLRLVVSDDMQWAGGWSRAAGSLLITDVSV